jgi:RimJ/RimL family protein N-acetyltransferase
MSAPPKTVLTATPQEEQAIREAVRSADPQALGPWREVASAKHADAVLDFLLDPAVSDPVYDLPRPFTLQSVRAWTDQCEELRRRGEGLLILTISADGVVTGYSKVSVWPDRSSAELGGALRANVQSAGAGAAGAKRTIGWMFDALKVRLICLTAALDNVRSVKLIDSMGFRRMGERDAVRRDGTRRRSLYWELTCDEWKSGTR